MRTLFYQDYDKSSFSGSMKKDVFSALTMHPVKDPNIMHKIHIHFKVSRLAELKARKQVLQSEIMRLRYENEGMVPDDKRETSGQQTNGFVRSLTYDRQKAVEDYVARKTGIKHRQSVNLVGKVGMAFKGGKVFKEGLASNDGNSPVTQTLEVLTEDNPIWGHAIFSKVHFTNPSCVHHKFRGLMKNSTNQLAAFMKAYDLGELKPRQIRARYQAFTVIHGLQHTISLANSEGYQSFLLSSTFGHLQWRELGEHALQDNVKESGLTSRGAAADPLENGIGQNQLHGGPPQPSWPNLNILLTLQGRHQSYLRFLLYLATAVRAYPANVHLRVALYDDPHQNHSLSLQVRFI